MQNVLTLETKKYAIKIENFEGPLDLLCHLIDKNKMNIYDIKLSEIDDDEILKSYSLYEKFRRGETLSEEEKQKLAKFNEMIETIDSRIAGLK